MEFEVTEEVLLEEPADIPLNQLLGRKLYLDILKILKTISLCDFKDWSEYEIKYDKSYRLSFEKYSGCENISYIHNIVENKLRIVVYKNVLPLEIRAIVQHLIREFKK
jgi:hypothetical protein